MEKISNFQNQARIMKIFQKIKNIIFKERYESKNLLDNYIRSQYGPFLSERPFHSTESFYKKILIEAKPYIKDGMKILDVGCATGRISFELASMGNVHCIGIDLSKKFIDFTNKFKKGLFPHINFFKQTSKNIDFFVDDILNTNLEKNSFDFIVCVNIFDRVKNPLKLIDVLYFLLKNYGVLLIVSPYDWALSPALKKYQSNDMKQFFPKDIWILEKEVKNLSYIIPIQNKKERTYNCHMLIVRKI